MKIRARFVSSIAVAMASITVAMTMGSAFAPSAYADGKATLGCSPPYTQHSIAYIDTNSQSLVTLGFFTQDSLMALLTSLDHNGDGFLCDKTPSGWYGPPATNGAHRAGFVNLVDNKVISG
jgi:hypothetical protein